MEELHSSNHSVFSTYIFFKRKQTYARYGTHTAEFNHIMFELTFASVLKKQLFPKAMSDVVYQDHFSV